MDAVTLGLAQADAARKVSAATKGAAAVLLDAIRIGQESAAVYFIGDSTFCPPIGSPEVPRQVANWLAAQFPAYTVRYRTWNDTNQTYDATVTVQTGTGTGNAGGPFVLDVYNASASGKAATYPNQTIARFALMFPVVAKLAIINHGHNSAGVTTLYPAQQLALIRDLRDTYPGLGIIQIAQTPRNPAGDSYTNDYVADLYRSRVVMSLSGSEGLGLINACEAFLDNPNYVAQWLSNDGLHPNFVGSALIGNLIIDAFRASRNAQPYNPATRRNRLVIPASRFQTYAGSPVFELVNSMQYGWSFPAAADSEIIADIDFPEGWQACDIHAHWTTQTGAASGSREVAWLTYHQRQALGANSVQEADSVTAAGTWVGQQATPVQGRAIASTTYGIFDTIIQPNVPIPLQAANPNYYAGFATGYRLKRNGANATYDKLAAKATLLRLVLRRTA